MEITDQSNISVCSVTAKDSGNLSPWRDPCGKVHLLSDYGNTAPRLQAATSSLAPKIPLFPIGNYNTENGVSGVCVCAALS